MSDYDTTVHVAISADISQFRAEIQQSARDAKKELGKVTEGLKKADLSKASKGAKKTVEDVRKDAKEMADSVGKAGEEARTSLEGIEAPDLDLGKVEAPDVEAPQVEVPEMEVPSADGIDGIKEAVDGLKEAIDRLNESIGQVKQGTENALQSAKETVDDAQVPSEEEGPQKANSPNLGENAEKSGKKVGGVFDRAKQSVNGMVQSLKSIPGAVGQSAGQISKMGKSLQSAGTLGKLGIAGVVAMIGVTLAKKVFDVSKSLGHMFDPVKNEKTTEKLNQSLKKMKTAIGAVLEPLYEIMATVIGGIADGITTVVKGIMTAVGFMRGLLGVGRAVNETVEDTGENAKEATEASSAGLSSWDMLNNVDTGEMGDLATSTAIQEAMDDAFQSGEKLRKSLGGFVGDFPRKLTTGLGNVWSSIKTVSSSVISGISSALGGVWTWLKSTGETVFNAYVTFYGKIWDGITAIAGTVAETLGNAWNTLTETAGKVWDGLKNGANKVFEGLKDRIRENIEFAKSLITSAVDRLKGIVSRVWEGLTDGIKTVGNLVIEVLNTIIKGWNSTFGKIKIDSNILGSHIKFGFPTIDSIPKLATGTVAEPNNPYLALIGDNKREPEIVSPVGTIKKAVREVLAEQGGQNSAPAEITLKINGKTLARYAYRDFLAEGRRRGDVA